MNRNTNATTTNADLETSALALAQFLRDQGFNAEATPDGEYARVWLDSRKIYAGEVVLATGIDEQHMIVRDNGIYVIARVD